MPKVITQIQITGPREVPNLPASMKHLGDQHDGHEVRNYWRVQLNYNAGGEPEYVIAVSRDGWDFNLNTALFIMSPDAVIARSRATLRFAQQCLPKKPSHPWDR